MSTFVLSGSRDVLGSRVAAALREAGHELHEFAGDEAPMEIKARADGADAVIHLGGDVETPREVLDVAASIGAAHVVVLSSATAYGAWPNNPVPLTEDALLRPCPDLDF